MQSVTNTIYVISGKIKKKILDQELHGKIKDQVRLENILSAFPLKVETTLGNYRVSLVGKAPHKRRRSQPIREQYLEGSDQ